MIAILEIVRGRTNKLRSSERSPPAAEPNPAPAVEPAGGPEPGEGEDDPYYYGWRWGKPSAGSDGLRQEPLTYDDLLSPEVGDFIAEDTIHHQVTADIEAILKRRHAGDETVAVWGDLKISFRIPGLTTGPGPDVCVVEGVEDRERYRRSFRYGKEPGKVVLTVEVVSHKSAKKDLEDILEIYRRLGVEEYLAIRPLGYYADGPFELRGWRRNPRSGRLEPIQPDRQGRLRLRTQGLLVGTGAEGWGVKISDAATGERLRSPVEEEARRAFEAEERAAMEAEGRLAAEEEAFRAKAQARQAEEQARQEAAARRAIEEEKRQVEEERRKAEEERRKAEEERRKAEEERRKAEEERRKAEEEKRQMAAEIERLRALQPQSPE